MSYLALFVSLPTKASTGRMRVWRSVKALGCATLRDGVYLLPDSVDSAAVLDEVAGQAVAAGGSGEIYRLSGCDEAREDALRALFDRGEEYANIAGDIKDLGRIQASLDGAVAARKLQALVRRFEQVIRIDFFPGEAQRQTLSLLDDLRDALIRRMAPDEPTARQADIPRRARADYQGRIWATRARPWVDRLATAWLIRRFIDPKARIVWLASPRDCQADWLGFDFDGATFSHVGARVTFETLLASFGLEAEPALLRLGELVHCLDAGGLPVPEAPGIEALLAGLRASEPDDDVLLGRACEIFDWLLQNYKDKTT
ncbi:chromate resistance protein ChrB domain-containing protein [Thauera sp. WB-2]|uniref:chromate resistance protein ChrB domain-containing protein n=1 Tax=Thauera sp. WB-2 TaxID=2897772 RepID=UPI0022DE07A2|nr:chromate resistance protein ChrB domain-containing protein [Thauera sp. WB-2]WBL63633.1 chromate resistance protein [Thauera sp. WB-2]